MDTDNPLEEFLPAADLNPCASCHTDCCKHYDVFVTGHDIVRLSSALKLQPIRFLRMHEVADEGRATARLGRGWYLLALRKFGDACAFLADDGRLRCTVDAFKPSTCRNYPFQLEGTVISQRPDKLCPCDWMMNSEFDGVWRPQLESHRREAEFHLETVHAWNERMGGKAGLRWIPMLKSVSVATSLSAFLKFVVTRVEATKAEGGPGESSKSIVRGSLLA